MLISLTDADDCGHPACCRLQLPRFLAQTLRRLPPNTNSMIGPPRTRKKGCTAFTPYSMQSGVQGRLADWTPFWGSLVMRFRFQRDVEIRMFGGDIGSRHGGCGADMGEPQYQWCWPASATSGTEVRLLLQLGERGKT